MSVNKYATKKSRRKGGLAIKEKYGITYFSKIGKNGRKKQLKNAKTIQKILKEKYERDAKAPTL